LAWPYNKIIMPRRICTAYRCGVLLLMCRRVCVCVCARHEMEPCKNGWTDRDGVWHVGPSNHVLYGSLDLPRETGMLGHARGRYIQQQDAVFY